MKSLFIMCLILSFSAIAKAEQKIHVNIEADEYGEYLDYSEDIGVDWIKTDDGYYLNKIIAVSELPFKSCIYNSCLNIRKNGYVSFGGFVGDQDAGAEAFFYLPTLQDGTFFKSATPYHFNVEGGEYASGLWSTSADIKIMILD